MPVSRRLRKAARSGPDLGAAPFPVLGDAVCAPFLRSHAGTKRAGMAFGRSATIFCGLDGSAHGRVRHIDPVRPGGVTSSLGHELQR